MEQTFDNWVSSITSYFIATFGLMTQIGVLTILGGLTLAVRLIYDTIRLVRYIRDPEHRAPE